MILLLSSFLQGGGIGPDDLYGAAIGQGESVVLGGKLNVNATHDDFVAVKLDASGIFVWQWQVTSGSEYMEDQGVQRNARF